MNNILNNLLLAKRHYLKLLVFAFTDAVLIPLSIYLAFLIRFEGAIPAQYYINIVGTSILASIVILPIFYFFKLYSFAWLYVSTTELINLTKASFLSFLILTTMMFLLKEEVIFSGFPRSVLFLTYVLIFMSAGSTRFAKRVYLQLFSLGRGEKKEKTLIVGAGSAGEQILRSILTARDSAYFPIGLIDDAIAKQGSFIHGVKVLGRIDDIPGLIEVQNIKDGTMIIAMPSVESQVISKVVEKGRMAGLQKIKILPAIDKVINGRVEIGILKEVQLEDLLGRDEISLDKNLIKSSIEGKKVLVSGGAGSIGSELCRQVASFKPDLLIILDQDETGIFNISEELRSRFAGLKYKAFVANIQDSIKMEQIFELYKPNIIFHAAAYKHVPLMEEQPEEAVKNNIIGTQVLSKVALANEVEKFIFISTDKAVNPSSSMGATKRIGEMICQSKNSKGKSSFISVRFGNVLGSRGSVIPVFKNQIEQGGPVKITHSDMKRYFMTTPEACLLVMQAGAMGQGGEVFVLDMGDPIKIIDLAKELIRLSGLEPDKDIPIVFTETRPGEKFTEELLTAEEGTIATQNQKIFTAKLSRINEDDLFSGIEQLKDLAYNGRREDILRKLKELIPTYNG